MLPIALMVRLLWRGGGAATHNVNTLVPCDTNFGALRTEINTDNAHRGRRSGGLTGDMAG